MTSSLRQIEANRRNASKSTGSKTPQGKAVVALNAMKHGLLSREAVIQGESEADLGKRLRRQLAPVGALELLLIDRIVSTAWRLRRAIALEAMLLGNKGADGAGSLNPLAFRPDRDKLLTFSCYEAALERSLYKALHELQCLQAERRRAVLPGRIDCPGLAEDRLAAVVGEAERVRVLEVVLSSGIVEAPPDVSPEPIVIPGLKPVVAHAFGHDVLGINRHGLVVEVGPAALASDPILEAAA